MTLTELDAAEAAARRRLELHRECMAVAKQHDGWVDDGWAIEAHTLLTLCALLRTVNIKLPPA